MGRGGPRGLCGDVCLRACPCLCVCVRVHKCGPAESGKSSGVTLVASHLCDVHLDSRNAREIGLESDLMDNGLWPRLNGLRRMEEDGVFSFADVRIIWKISVPLQLWFP